MKRIPQVVGVIKDFKLIWQTFLTREELNGVVLRVGDVLQIFLRGKHSKVYVWDCVCAGGSNWIRLFVLLTVNRIPCRDCQ